MKDILLFLGMERSYKKPWNYDLLEILHTKRYIEKELRQLYNVNSPQKILPTTNSSRNPILITPRRIISPSKTL